jgi:uncharacterized LabA/DUF88 family protein
MGQKTVRLLDVAVKILTQLPKPNAQELGLCEIRLYGGWYEMETMTKKAQALFVSIQKEFPKVINLPNKSEGSTPINISALLAVALNEDPSRLLFNTFRKKGGVNNVRIQKKEDIGCLKNDCTLLHLRNFLKNGKCPAVSCSVAHGSLLYRSEQKLVDTMLSCDLLYAEKQGFDHIVVVSDDDDFIPAIHTLLLRGAPVVRAHPKFSSQRQKIIIGGAQLHEMEL